MEKDEKLPPAGAPQPQPQPPLGDDAAKHTDASDLTLDSDLETAVEGVTPASRDDERKYLAGVQMWLMMSSLITASFLVLLDNAIVATVRFLSQSCRAPYHLECTRQVTNTACADRQSPKSPLNSTPSRTLAGMALPFSWPGKKIMHTCVPTQTQPNSKLAVTLSAAIQPLVGKIYTQFRLKHVYLAFFFIFELGSLICGVATSSTMLIVGRAVAGIGVAGVFAGALIIIGVAVRPEQRACEL